LAKRVEDWLVRGGHVAAFAGRTLAELPGALARPGLWAPQLYRALVGALPLALVCGAALGLVAWLQLRQLLVQFQALHMLPSALALTVVWEFGPVAAGLIAAGRLGAGLGAELASMRNTEQLDAALALGVPIGPRIVAPRVLACILALPLLAVFIDYIAVVSSFLAEAIGGVMSWQEYRRAALEYLKLKDAIPATLKTAVYGYLIGLCGCWTGLHAAAGTEGVGNAATQAVVRSIFAIVIADVLLVRMIQLLTP
jgi:phospholipid/cholesterol/gamma-HCH transport system permease protein